MLDDRRASVQNEEKTKITSNKTVMDYTLKHETEQV